MYCAGSWCNWLHREETRQEYFAETGYTKHAAKQPVYFVETGYTRRAAKQPAYCAAKAYSVGKSLAAPEFGRADFAVKCLPSNPLPCHNVGWVLPSRGTPIAVTRAVENTPRMFWKTCWGKTGHHQMYSMHHPESVAKNSVPQLAILVVVAAAISAESELLHTELLTSYV